MRCSMCGRDMPGLEGSPYRHWCSECWENHTDEVRELVRKDRNGRHQKSEQYYLARDRLQGRVTSLLRRGIEIQEITGCSLDALMRHLESQFQSGMTWDNMGKWHIDHVIPCCRFDLAKLSEQKACFHYTNLQPLWAVDNCVKGSN